jgi:beta-phosphoglucomutase-like phosphatase (HAD superfamily)
MTPTLPPKAVILDCDGVLVDSEPIAFALVAEDLTRHGLPMSADQAQARFIGGTIPGLADKARAMGARLPVGWADDFSDRLIARFADGTPVMPGVEDLIDRLERAAVAFAVGSNGTLARMAITIGQHPRLWSRLKGKLFSGDDMGRAKPDPAVYLAAAHALGQDPADCVVIDDSPSGCRAARAAGMRCLGFARRADPDRLRAEGALPVMSMDEAALHLGV